ncbi:MAG: hypothetical protein KHX21_07150 [Clostridium sp.]|nr:hypothetical protein [Clostridium sp.]
MKKLYIAVIALMMLCTGCNSKTTPEPQTIPPVEAPVQQGGNNTAAPDESMPTTQPMEISELVENDISPEIPDDLREALESGYAEAKAINADVAGTVIGFDTYASDGKIYDNPLIKSEKREYYAQYWMDGKWVKYGSMQILGGKLNEDGTEVDGQILIFSKHYSNISFIVNRETAPTDIEPIWLNLGGKIREYKVFAIQAVEIDNWEDFISHETGYIPHEAYELIEIIENMDADARTAYYAALAKDFCGEAFTVTENDGVIIVCGSSYKESEWRDKMAAVYCVGR